MAGKVKGWVWIVLAIVVIGVLAVITMAGVGVYFFSRHIETRTASASSAAREFEQVTTRFTGQKPLIELDDRGRYLRSNTDRPQTRTGSFPNQLEVLAFDPEHDRIVHVKIPFWLLRMKTRGSTIDFNGSKMDLDDLKLTVEDLERFGPTLIVDHRSPGGDRVLVWSQQGS
jgi:hypothetical protein